MTGKLMKYEFRSVFKQIGVIWAALPAVAILTSFTGWIYARSALAQENDQLLGALLSRIPMFLYVGLFIALVVATLFVVVMRFYKGLLKVSDAYAAGQGMAADRVEGRDRNGDGTDQHGAGGGVHRSAESGR